ncbi:MAG: TIGR03545 family protein [Calditrichaeota bacterium]|nr:MAG: TIGR03545 family protein [Calditrichota bacterium]
MIRWKGVIALLVLAGLVFGLSLIFTDRWLENRLEELGSAAVGAKVEFEGVDFSLLDLRLRWKRLQVTDPHQTMRNLFETGGCELDLALEPLFSQKYLIEAAQVQGLRFHTPRETDGKLSEAGRNASGIDSKLVRTLRRYVEEETRQMPLFNLNQFTRKVNVDSIAALVKLQSPHKIDSLKTLADQKYRQWDQRLNQVRDEQRLQRWREQIRALDPQKFKSVLELKQGLETARRLHEEISAFKKNVETLKRDFQEDAAAIRQLPRQVPAWIEQDYRQALALARIPDVSVKNVARLLFGQRILNQIQTITGYVGQARYYAQKFQAARPAKERPPRLQGQYIHFGRVAGTPKFWIQRVELSGETAAGLQFSGHISDIVSNQRVVGKPTVIELGGRRPDGAALNFQATLNYLEDTPREALQLNLSGIPLKDEKLTDFALLPSRIARGKGFIEARIDFAGEELRSRIRFLGKALQFAEEQVPPKLHPRLLQIRRALVGAIQEVEFQAEIRKTGEQFIFHLSSNLDELVAGELKKVLTGEVQQARRKLEQKVRAEVEPRKAELERFIEQHRQRLTREIDALDQQVQQLRRQLEQQKKALEDRIKKEGKGLLDKLFK